MRRQALGIVSLLAGLTLGPAALAQPDRRAPTPDQMQRMEQRFERKSRVMRLLAITEVLDLTDAQALALDHVLERYDARRRPLQQVIFQGVQVLRRAARGDATAFAEVDATLDRMVKARAQLHAIDYQMFQELAKGRPPQQRAKLALVMARLPTEMRAMARQEHMHGRHGDE